MRQLILQCIELEETIGKIYRNLAAGPGLDDRLRELLAELAREEDDHANQLRLAARLLNENICSGAKVSRQRIADSLSRARGLWQQVQEAALGMEATIALAIRLEKEFADVHAHCALDFVDPKMATLFRKMAADDQRHAQAMQEYSVRRGRAGG